MRNSRKSHCKDTPRQSRNQKNLTEANEGNEEREKLCQKCAILGNRTAKTEKTPCAFALLYRKVAHFWQHFSVSVFSVCSCSNSLVAACRATPLRLCVINPCAFGPNRDGKTSAKMNDMHKLKRKNRQGKAFFLWDLCVLLRLKLIAG
jgi:hypothetical protein